MKRFTLIELFAVITVILILASLLLPSVFTARKFARQAVCFSNLKQINMLEYLFVKDNRQWVTPTSPRPTTPPQVPIMSNYGAAYGIGTYWLTWDDMLGISYDGRNLDINKVRVQEGSESAYPTKTKTSLIYNCPLDKRSNGNLVARTYAINLEIAQGNYETVKSGTNLSKIQNPGKSILMTERVVNASPVLFNDTTNIIDNRGAVIGNDEIAGFSNGNIPGSSEQVCISSLTSDKWISFHPRSGDLPWLFVDGHIELKNRLLVSSFLPQ